MLMLPPFSWCTREIWAWPLAVAPSLPERQGRTTSRRWEKKAPTGALRRLFSSWEGREHSVGRQARRSRGDAGTRLVRTCALLWMATVSMLSCHTYCRSVRRIWYSVSPKQLLVSSWQPPMSTGSQGWCRRRRRREASGSITHRPKTLTGSKGYMVTDI